MTRNHSNNRYWIRFNWKIIFSKKIPKIPYSSALCYDITCVAWYDCRHRRVPLYIWSGKWDSILTQHFRQNDEWGWFPSASTEKVLLGSTKLFNYDSLRVFGWPLINLVYQFDTTAPPPTVLSLIFTFTKRRNVLMWKWPQLNLKPHYSANILANLTLWNVKDKNFLFQSK